MAVGQANFSFVDIRRPHRVDPKEYHSTEEVVKLLGLDGFVKKGGKVWKGLGTILVPKIKYLTLWMTPQGLHDFVNTFIRHDAMVTALSRRAKDIKSLANAEKKGKRVNAGQVKLAVISPDPIVWGKPQVHERQATLLLTGAVGIYWPGIRPIRRVTEPLLLALAAWRAVDLAVARDRETYDFCTVKYGFGNIKRRHWSHTTNNLLGDISVLRTYGRYLSSILERKRVNPSGRSERLRIARRAYGESSRGRRYAWPYRRFSNSSHALASIPHGCEINYRSRKRRKKPKAIAKAPACAKPKQPLKRTKPQTIIQDVTTTRTTITITIGGD